MLNIQDLRTILRTKKKTFLTKGEIAGLTCFLIQREGETSLSAVQEYAEKVLGYSVSKSAAHYVFSAMADYQYIEKVTLSHNAIGRSPGRYKVNSNNFKIVPELAELWNQYERENFFRRTVSE